MFDPFDRLRRELARAERPGSPDQIGLRSYVNNLGETRFVVEGRNGAIHCGDKVFKTYPDALAFAKMEAGYHGAKLVDEALHGLA